MKKIFSFLLAFFLLIPVIGEARPYYGNLDIKGKIILNDNDIDSGGNIHGDTGDFDQIIVDTATVKQQLDMDSNAIIFIDWQNSDTSGLRAPNADVADTAQDSNKLQGYTPGNDTGNIPIANGKAVVGLISDTATNALNVRESNVHHGDLSGLADDDHPQYFLDDGTDSMSGDLDMNGNNVDSASIVFADTVGKNTGSDSTVFRGIVDCANDEYLSGNGCRQDQQSSGASLVVEDDGSVKENQADTANFRDGLRVENPRSRKVIIDAFMENFLDPDGLVIDTGGASDSASISTGGQVYVDWVGSGETTPRIVSISSGDTVKLQESGCNGLINGTLTTNAWYEFGVAADADNNKDPCLVAWEHQSGSDQTPTTTGELPSGYELLREMGTPGKTWWVLTDGSSNIISFTHNSSGELEWDELSNFSRLLDANPGPSSATSLDISAQVPPTKVNLVFNLVTAQDVMYLSSYSHSSTFGEQEVILDQNDGTGNEGSPIELKNVESQEVYYSENGGDDQTLIEKVSKFKAVN